MFDELIRKLKMKEKRQAEALAQTKKEIAELEKLLKAQAAK